MDFDFDEDYRSCGPFSGQPTPSSASSPAEESDARSHIYDASPGLGPSDPLIALPPLPPLLNSRANEANGGHGQDMFFSRLCAASDVATPPQRRPQSDQTVRLPCAPPLPGSGASTAEDVSAPPHLPLTVQVGQATGQPLESFGAGIAEAFEQPAVTSSPTHPLNGSGPRVAAASPGCPPERLPLPQPPNEDAFVAARPSVRRQEYQRLQVWLAAGGSAQQFTLFFREMLMDADGPAFIEACNAVAAHYSHVAAVAAKPAALLNTFGSVTSAAGALQLLGACVEHRVVKEPELRAISRAVAGAAPGLLAGSDGVTNRLPLASFVFALGPSLRSECFDASLLRFLEGLAETGVPIPGPLAAPNTGAFNGSPGSAAGNPPASPQYLLAAAQSPQTAMTSPLVSDPLRLLAESSTKTWRQRLACLDGILGPDGGFHGLPVLWPQLVLQAEDDHPAVAAAALRAITRLAPSFGEGADGRSGQLGDHLAARLAAAIRARLREGRARDVEAAFACVSAFARSPIVLGGPGPLSSFLTQALGCPKERARAAVAEILAAGTHGKGALVEVQDAGNAVDLQATTPLKGASDKDALTKGTPLQKQLTPILETLLLEACPPRRLASKRASPGHSPCTPTPSPGPARFKGLGVAISPPPIRGFAASSVSPVERATPSAILPLPPFSPDDDSPEPSPQPFYQNWQGQAASPAPLSGTSPWSGSTFSPQPGPQEQAMLWTFAVRPPAEETTAKPSRYASLAGTPPPPSRSPPADSPVRLTSHQMDQLSQLHQLQQPLPRSACTPPRRGPSRSTGLFGGPLSSTPEARQADDAEHARYQTAPQYDLGAIAEAWKACGQPASAGSSFAGPQLQAESKLLGFSSSHSSHMMRSYAAANSASTLAFGNAAAAAFQTVGLPGTVESVLFEETQVVSVVSEAARLEKQLGDGLQELLAGRSATKWHAALQALALWDGADSTEQAVGCQAEDPSPHRKALVQVLLSAGARLPPAAQPELWRALMELSQAAPIAAPKSLQHASWLPETALLELAVRHCLAFTEPQVVAAFLVAQVAEGRISAAGALEFCFGRLPPNPRGPKGLGGGGGGGGGRLARLILCMVKGCLAFETPLLADLVLPSLPAVSEWACTGQLAPSTAPPLRTALELLLQHLAPESIPERCWCQLLKFLGPGHQRPILEATAPAAKARGAPSTRPNVAVSDSAKMFQPMGQGLHNSRAQTDASSMDTAVDSGDDDDGSFAASAAGAGGMLEAPPGATHGSYTSDVSFPLGGADPGVNDLGELASTFGRLHKITLALSRQDGGDEVLEPLQTATQLLSRTQIFAPLRAFLRRLLARQRVREFKAVAAKENFPPPPAGAQKFATSSSSSGGGNASCFLSDDYASVRELSADEGLAGAFPHSLLAHLKRLLRAPAAAATHRAAAECLGAVAQACGSLLLRVLLGHFAAALLRQAATRGPAQAAARSTLAQLVALEDTAVAVSSSFLRPRSDLRVVWRALVQSVSLASGGNSRPGGLSESRGHK
ncbi:unnamed protein product [Polarella glacialis]|uniref:Uncharacterized protein n=1 Tax=Polarella glacialis TaxID=89957 RepID=A0A813G0X7_POLGL|nr:unnamed protein product [Polarella glacialis]